MPSPIDIECELKVFLTDAQYDELFMKLRRIAMYGGDDEQVTFYFEGNGNPDIRIQRNAQYSKITYKGGKIHDEARREIEVEFLREDFEKMQALLEALGYRVCIKWFRHRHLFKLDDVTVALDDTRGYGKILELDKVCMAEEREATLQELHAKLAELGVEPTPREEFERRYAHYKAHWKELTGEAS
jgi:predicted adenylyl cyclase CyaB